MEELDRDLWDQARPDPTRNATSDVLTFVRRRHRLFVHEGIDAGVAKYLV